jgi:AmmeMemoRadiSam system protein B/AmmeMemoRadiSam system protein A
MKAARPRVPARSLVVSLFACLSCSTARFTAESPRSIDHDLERTAAASGDSPLPAQPPAAPRRFASGPVRAPAVAGRFYPVSPDALRAAVASHLGAAERVDVPGAVIAIISPHAGYDFSGPVAGWAFGQLAGSDADVAILVGGHARSTRAAVFACGGYGTPLGDVPVDDATARAICDAGPQAQADTAAHASADHALEVLVPFLQTVRPGLPVVPVYFNTDDVQAARRVGAAIARGARGRRPVILCSTDLSHYPDAATAREADGAILDAIVSLDVDRLAAENRRVLAAYEHRGLSCAVCGLGGVIATLEAAKMLGATGARLLRYENSGDRPMGDGDRVVGYGAVVIYGSRPMEDASAAAETDTGGERLLSDDERGRLLALARLSVKTSLAGEPAPQVADPTPAMASPAAAFVTLHRRGQLRGCIGTFDRSKPLWRVVVEFARHAAFSDSRFEPVTAVELAEIAFEISVLSPLRKLDDPLDIRLGVDGIWVVGSRGERGTFLPQVATETGWSKEAFLSNCASHKAGLAPDAWRDPQSATVFAYTAEVFGEGEP